MMLEGASAYVSADSLNASIHFIRPAFSVHRDNFSVSDDGLNPAIKPPLGGFMVSDPCIFYLFTAGEEHSIA